MSSRLSVFNLFKKMTPDELAAIEQCGTFKTFMIGETAFAGRINARAILLVIDGQLDVQRQEKDSYVKHLAEISPGGTIGEVGLLDGVARRATATAKMKTTCWIMTESGLDEARKLSPVAANKLVFAVARNIAGRLIDVQANIGAHADGKTTSSEPRRIGQIRKSVWNIITDWVKL